VTDRPSPGTESDEDRRLFNDWVESHRTGDHWRCSGEPCEVQHLVEREAALPEPPSRDTIERLLSEANVEGWTHRRTANAIVAALPEPPLDALRIAYEAGRTAASFEDALAQVDAVMAADTSGMAEQIRALASEKGTGGAPE
jgi:hypothetical protein